MKKKSLKGQVLFHGTVLENLRSKYYNKLPET